MHESVVTLQRLLDEERTRVREMSALLERADQRGVRLPAEQYLLEQIHLRTKKTDEHEGLIGDYTAAVARGDTVVTALRLVQIQLTAALVIEDKSVRAANGISA